MSSSFDTRMTTFKSTASDSSRTRRNHSRTTLFRRVRHTDESRPFIVIPSLAVFFPFAFQKAWKVGALYVLGRSKSRVNWGLSVKRQLRGKPCRRIEDAYLPESLATRRLRPLRRRLLSTSAPSLVDMRARNPWVRRRFTLLG